MRQSEPGEVYKLVWALDLVSNSCSSYINLVFQNINTNYFLIDSIPPELLSYCFSSQRFSGGKRRGLSIDLRELRPLQFTINSSDRNYCTEARHAFMPADYNLSLNDRMTIYSRVCQNQICFVQQVDDLKIVIPCFVIAATYYFKSTALREAVLSRRLTSLYHSCELDKDARHARIYLKSKGNLGDAKNIARFALDTFANRRFNQLKDYHYADTGSAYRRIKADFPVEQTLTIDARGIWKRRHDGSKIYIVLHILSEDSSYPFDSLDIYYDKDEDKKEPGEDQETFPQPIMGHSKKMVTRPPSTGIVQVLLQSCRPVENANSKSIKENRIPMPRIMSDDGKSPKRIYDGQKPDLSAQPEVATEDLVAKGDIQDAGSEEQDGPELSLELFIQMAAKLEDKDHVLKLIGGDISAVIENFEITTSLVHQRREGDKYKTRKESYDNTVTGRRKCSYITFTCNGLHICLVEIDQTGIGSDRCSTRVLISDREIGSEHSESCVEDYVLGVPLTERNDLLKDAGIVLKTKNHPRNYDENAQDDWRARLLWKIIGGTA